MKVLALILLLSCAIAESAGNQTLPTRFLTVMPVDPHGGLFVIPAPPHTSYFLNPVVGLQIDSVWVDGVAVTPVRVDGPDIQPAFDQYTPILPEMMLYQVPIDRIRTLRTLDQLTGHMSIDSFQVAGDARRVEIAYRVRYPGNRLSPTLTFVAVDRSEFKAADGPNQSLEPTPTAVTPRADARVAPAVGVAHH